MRSSSCARPAVEVQRVQRVAGDDRVERRPTRTRRDRGQRQIAAAACASLVPRRPGAPQPVDAAQHPRVRAQQPGGREQQRTPACRAAAVRPRARPPTRSARCRRCRGSPARRGSRRRSGSARSSAATAPTTGPKHSRPSRYTPATSATNEAIEPSTIRRAPPWPKIEQNIAEGDRQRMLGRAAVDLEVGQVQVQQVAAPQQRVEGVVGRVGGEREVADQRADAQRREADASPTSSAGTARSRASRVEPGLQPGERRAFHLALASSRA